jgi:hypothetical protein
MTVPSNRMLTALRLLAESYERPGSTSVGRPADEVRRTEDLAERARVARRALISSHRAEDAATGVYVVPRRPDILSIPISPEWTTKVSSA